MGVPQHQTCEATGDPPHVTHRLSTLAHEPSGWERKGGERGGVRQEERMEAGEGEPRRRQSQNLNMNWFEYNNKGIIIMMLMWLI